MQVPSDCSQKVQFRFAIIAAAVFVSKQKDICLCCRCRLAFSNILLLFKIYTDFAFCAVGKVRSQQQFGVFRFTYKSAFGLCGAIATWVKFLHRVKEYVCTKLAKDG